MVTFKIVAAIKNKIAPKVNHLKKFFLDTSSNFFLLAIKKTPFNEVSKKSTNIHLFVGILPNVIITAEAGNNNKTIPNNNKVNAILLCFRLLIIQNSPTELIADALPCNQYIDGRSEVLEPKGKVKSVK